LGFGREIGDSSLVFSSFVRKKADFDEEISVKY